MTEDRSTGPAAAQPIRCVVAGGSLVGLSAAIALSRLGFEVTVVERSPARAIDGGGGLGVDVALLREVTGIDADPPVLHGIDRDGTAWHLLQGWLEEHAARLPGVSVLRGTAGEHRDAGRRNRSATDLRRGRPGSQRDAYRQDDTFAADLVVGADGARSTVRATVDPAHPDARYAGVLLWRTLVDEQAMPPDVTLPRAGEPAREVYAGPYRLVTYPVPGPGARRPSGTAASTWSGMTPSSATCCTRRACSTARRCTAPWRPARCPPRSGSAWPTSRRRGGPARGARR
jgi:2-polyprenyl-6-methoxyphenol hydroxylase-like FAD-dependent oxidoreductase